MTNTSSRRRPSPGMMVVRPAASTPGSTRTRLEQLFEERQTAGVVGITVLREVHFHREHVVLRESEVRAAQLLIAAQQQPCADEQHHGEANFKASSICRRRARPRPPLCEREDSCSAVSTRVSRVLSAGISPASRPHPTIAASAKRATTASMWMESARGMSSRVPMSQWRIPSGEQQTQQSSCDRQQHALDHLFPQQAQAAAAQCGADRCLFAACGGARHQQVRNVETRDKQQTSGGAEQRIEVCLDVVGVRVDQRTKVHGVIHRDRRDARDGSGAASR